MTSYFPIYFKGDPPGPVSDLQVIALSYSTLTVNWTAFGVIYQYEVTYSFTVKRCSELGSTMTELISDGSVRSHTLRNLSEDSSYTITVRAINTVGLENATLTVDTLTAGELLVLLVAMVIGT